MYFVLLSLIERVAPPTVTHPLTLEYSALCEIAESLGRPGKELFGWDSCTRTFNEAFMIAVHPCIWEGVQCNLRTELNHTHLVCDKHSCDYVLSIDMMFVMFE